MGVQTDVVIADQSEAQDIVNCDAPASNWDGFTFNGFHNVHLCTLLSLLKASSPSAEFDHYLNMVELITPRDQGTPAVSAVRPEEVAELSAVASLDEDEFESLAQSWGATEEFNGWTDEDVRELLRELGDLAESASLERKWLFLWQSL
jgi:hypothetical protein